jgi:hypothetical protein
MLQFIMSISVPGFQKLRKMYVLYGIYVNMLFDRRLEANTFSLNSWDPEGDNAASFLRGPEFKSLPEDRQH